MKRGFHDHLVSAASQRGREPKRSRGSTELAERLRFPWDEWYQRAEEGINQTGIPCKVRPVFLPGEIKGRGTVQFKRETEPLFALEILDAEMPTTRPATDAPYHISLDFVRDDLWQRWRIQKVTRKFMGKQVTLRGRVSGSTFELDPETCDVASDPHVQALHRWGAYSDRPIHVSL